MEEDKAVGLMLRGRSSGDIRIFFAVDDAVVKEHGGCTEYEIGGAFYVTVSIVLTAAFPACVQRILVTKQAAIADNTAVAFYMEGNCLSYLAGGIFDSDIFEPAVVARKEYGIGVKGVELVFAHPIITGVRLARVIGVGDNGAVAAFTDEVNACFPGRDDQLFVVGAFFDEDLDGGQRSEIADAVNGGLYGGKVAGAVGSDDDVV